MIFFLNPSPTNGPLRETLELQSIKFEVSPNLLFGLFYVKFLALSHFFPILESRFVEKKFSIVVNDWLGSVVMVN